MITTTTQNAVAALVAAVAADFAPQLPSAISVQINSGAGATKNVAVIVVATVAGTDPPANGQYAATYVIGAPVEVPA